jgi:hypothetical protein
MSQSPSEYLLFAKQRQQAKQGWERDVTLRTPMSTRAKSLRQGCGSGVLPLMPEQELLGLHPEDPLQKVLVV